MTYRDAPHLKSETDLLTVELSLSAMNKAPEGAKPGSRASPLGWAKPTFAGYELFLKAFRYLNVALFKKASDPRSEHLRLSESTVMSCRTNARTIEWSTYLHILH